ncbi:dienelactone hydrolase family protein [Williamsia sp. CHRR-6]|uniref:dienelactone hydrolase family protein n=1 Tax=Williamsia sp. CHRR-6 TaxID=2835871 RepID=UPI001BDA25FE|nr:dienelactone hydrolase family protein [Williamsia sp. CHRR-6]MBT0568479.1 dienelactone hydrolase family protein [Williamsia sp. CHRR-6]
MSTDTLADFEQIEFSAHGRTAPVYRLGSGPAVVVMSEIPGITPAVADFARRVAAIGCTAVVPHLFGTDGKGLSAGAIPVLSQVSTLARAIVPACISREFTVLATGRTSPIVTWLRALAAAEHDRCGGPGVGAVGMCFTGGFALAMATDDRLLAPVLSQPSLPFPITASRRAAIDISPDDLAKVKTRCAAGDLTVIGLRFAGDNTCPPQRFAWLSEQLGDAFVAVELPDSSANPDSFIPNHSVLTECLVDEPGQPTRAALDDVLELFRSRLLTD